MDDRRGAGKKAEQIAPPRERKSHVVDGGGGGVGSGERNAKEQRCTQRAMGERKGGGGRWDRDTK